MKRLRFMPPTAFLYSNQPPNQVHNMQKFGPICKQRFPVDVPNENLIASHSLNNRKDSLKIQLRLMKSLLPKESFAELSPFIKRLSAFEQSEDCLNLNVYAPLQGKFRSTRKLTAITILARLNSFQQNSFRVLKSSAFATRKRSHSLPEVKNGW